MLKRLFRTTGRKSDLPSLPPPSVVLYLHDVHDVQGENARTLDLVGPVKLGRSVPPMPEPAPDNGFFNSQALSRLHAEVWHDNGTVWLRDVGSTNGTCVNGQPLRQEIGQAVALRSGDRIELGRDVPDSDGVIVRHRKVVLVVRIAVNDRISVATTSDPADLLEELLLSKPSVSNPVYSAADVAAHASPDDAWVSVDGKVYNITKFLVAHPGGFDVLLECAGTDVTEEFEAMGHTKNARQILEVFYVGDLKDWVRKPAADRISSHNVLSAGVEGHAKLCDTHTKRIVVAIDFGTSHSGYAFGKPGLYDALGNPFMAHHIGSLVHVRDNWPGATTRYPKTLSATLFDYDSQPVAHGDLALVKFTELRGKAIQQHGFVRRIKLLLADDYSYHDPFLNKHHLEPSQVIADFLSYLKGDVESQLQRAGYDMRSTKPSMTWVITIPAMWSDSAKDSMKAAAKVCGLLDNGGHVAFCLEPEAALLNCAIATNLVNNGDCVLVVDMGGGTVDLAAFQVRQASPGSTWHGLKFDMIVASDGRTCGATLFDDAFYEFFCQLLGVGTFDSIDSESQVHLFQEWERVKRTFDGDSDPPRWIKLDSKLQRKISEAKVAELVDQDRYDVDRNEVSVLPGEIIECFDKVFPHIVAVTMSMMSKARRASKPINKLLCVGGFSEMRYMQQRIRADLDLPNVTILFPLDSGASVVQGALLYGIDPASVQPIPFHDHAECSFME